MTDLVLLLLIFVIAGVVLLLTPLAIGKLVRPHTPSPEKGTIYECGEPTIGSAWIQFDLRFYVVALLFVIFDVELAFFFPWAVVFGSANRAADATLPAAQQVQAAEVLQPAGTAIDPAGMEQLAWLAFGDIMIFFAVLLVGFVYLWRRGDLEWVRSTAAQAETARTETQRPSEPEPAIAG
jgi:NADH-quinone oxidoreductase subunit A